jgi:hypothetical protein
MNPLGWLLPGWDTSKTERQLLSAFAMYKVFSSALSATLLVVDPEGASGKRPVCRVSITLRFLMSMTETLLSFALAT